MTQPDYYSSTGFHQVSLTPKSNQSGPQGTTQPWRLSTRLVRGVTGVVIGCLAIVSLMTGAFTRFEITERLDDSLQEVAERLQFAVLVLNQQGNGHDVAHLSNIMPTSLAYQITDSMGYVLLRSPNAPDYGFVTPPHAGFFNQQRFRVYIMPAAQPDRFILVGEPRMHRAQATQRAILIAVLPILGAIPCIWLLVVWIVRRSLRPLVQLQGEIQERGSGNLNPVPELDLPIELSTIQSAVNLLLNRLHKALAAERAFAANAAHELRNPIAALLAQAQMLRSTLADQFSDNGTDYPPAARTAHNATDAQHRLDAMISQIQRLSRIVEKLLQLSRAVAGTGLLRDIFDLLPVLHVVADELDRPQSNASPRLMIDTAAYTHFMVEGDMDAAGILLRNVLENALRHSPDGSGVRVNLAPFSATSNTEHGVSVPSNGTASDAATAKSTSVALTIENDAVALPPATLARLADPFVRGASQAEGSGLGLAIARTIAGHMNVPLSLSSPIPGQKSGFQVKLLFKILAS